MAKRYELVGGMLVSHALNARCIGRGPETIVLAHGFGTDQGVWQRFIPGLAQRFRVVTYDLACAGTADPSYFDLERHGSLEGHAVDLIEVLAEQKVSRCTFVGHSVSGMIGVLASVEHPELFQHLILIGASARYLDDGDYKGGFDAAAIETVLHAIEVNFRAFAQSYAPLAMDRPLEDPASQTFLASMLRMRPDIAVGMAKAIFFSDYRAVLPNCSVPTTVLQTRRDAAVTNEAALYLRDHLPQSDLEYIETTGHLPHLSAPEAVETALQRHLP
jgi:pimeloyl-ACP methyl ester carboxylesterase